MANQYKLISSKAAKTFEDLKTKASKVSTQYGDNKAKLLQRSVRLAREYRIRTNALRDSIMASQRKMREIRKACGYVCKQKIETMHRRSKHFKELQASEVRQ